MLDVGAAHLRDERVGADRGRELANGGDALCDGARRHALGGQLVAPARDRSNGECLEEGLSVARVEECGEGAVGGRVCPPGVRRRRGGGDRQRSLGERVDELELFPTACAMAQGDVGHAQRCVARPPPGPQCDW